MSEELLLCPFNDADRDHQELSVTASAGNTRHTPDVQAAIDVAIAEQTVVRLTGWKSEKCECVK